MDSQKKKKSKSLNQKSNPQSHRSQRKPNPNTVYIEQKQTIPQYKGVYPKKKKKKKPKQSKPKPNPNTVQTKPTVTSLVARSSSS